MTTESDLPGAPETPNSDPDDRREPAVQESAAPAVAGVSSEGQAPAPNGRPGRLSRFFEWFWSRRALAEALAQEPPPTALGFLERARTALALGELALEPGRPSDHGPMDALACTLFQEAVYWALSSHGAAQGPATNAGPTPSTNGGDPEAAMQSRLGELWQAVDPRELERAAPAASPLAELRQLVVESDFRSYAELSPSEQAALARVLQAFAGALCAGADSKRRAVQRIWQARWIKLGVVTAVLVTAVALTLFGIDRAERRHDLAAGKPWTASSKWPEGGCSSPRQSCPGEQRYFFSTLEEDGPWLEIDLQTKQRISGARIYNRQDCCGDRAVPLVIEISVDHKRWTEVARRESNFVQWKAKFPRVEARWVRVRAPRRTYLHLEAVRIIP